MALHMECDRATLVAMSGIDEIRLFSFCPSQKHLKDSTHQHQHFHHLSISFECSSPACWAAAMISPWTQNALHLQPMHWCQIVAHQQNLQNWHSTHEKCIICFGTKGSTKAAFHLDYRWRFDFEGAPPFPHWIIIIIIIIIVDIVFVIIFIVVIVIVVVLLLLLIIMHFNYYKAIPFYNLGEGRSGRKIWPQPQFQFLCTFKC